MVLFCFLLLFILFPNSAPAAEPASADSLPPVVVTATRTEVPVNQLTTSLAVITADDIRERQAEMVCGSPAQRPGRRCRSIWFDGKCNFRFHSRFHAKSSAGHDRRR